MARQPGGELRAQRIQRVGDQCARQVYAALVVGSVRAGCKSAWVFEVGVADHPHQPSPACRGVVLQGLSISKGQRRTRLPLQRGASVRLGGVSVGPSGMAVGLDDPSVGLEASSVRPERALV